MELESLQAVALAIAQERSVETVLQKIVEGLVAQPGVALARLWLKGAGDICARCPMRLECPQQTECLHLLASAGTPIKSGVEDWARLDGDFRRFPLGIRKIGKIAATGEALLLANLVTEPDWIARPKWAESEGILSFAGQPLIFRGEILGVLAIFSRQPLAQQEFNWLRMFADHAAVALANSRAFAEIEQLREQLKLENDYLREEVKQERLFGDIVGQSTALQKVLDQITLVAPSEANVLVLGESGTGKELIARAIHDRSQRSAGPLVKVNCASIPRDLFESEFFGHVRGAFTGAIRDRVGRFQLADGGTLFLDEVGEIPLDLQSKLLRVLQEGTFERVGEEKTRRANVRLVAATNRDLRRDVAAGTFRQDLYFRLSVFPIELPPLRERREDIPLLVRHFIQQASKRSRCGNLQLSTEQLRRLQNYSWPGNVRELQNVIERAMILSNCGTQPLNLNLILPLNETSLSETSLSETSLSETSLSETSLSETSLSETSLRETSLRETSLRETSLRETSLEDASLPKRAKTFDAAPVFLTQSEWEAKERDNLMAALETANWKIYGPGGAAELLGIKPTTLASRLQSLGIKKRRG